MRKIETLELYTYWLWNFFRYIKDTATHDYENVFLKRCRDLTNITQGSFLDTKLLILGCGYNYPDVILFSNISNNVIGLDVIGAFYRDGVIQTFKDVRKRRKGIVKTLALFLALLYKFSYYRYYRHLKKVSGVPIQHEKYKLFTYDGRDMPFDDEVFDLVLSNAVLEHVNDLERVFQEVYRVTKKKGISYHLWHNYYSLSGGHVPEPLIFKHPWSHLKGKYKIDNLNRLLPNEIKQNFSKYFDIIAFHQVDKNNNKKEIDDDFQFEGKELLSDNMQKELNNYPIDLLLTRGYLLIGKKK
jgi:SAM-dependent methyltransferase